MKLKFKWDYVFMGVVLLILVYLKGPQTLDLIKIQGTTPITNEVQLNAINSLPINSSGPRALVFWATWCGPCTVELKRINSLVQEGKISSDKIIAISLDETEDVVLSAIKERNYLFPVVLDQGFKLSQIFKVNSTPTIFLQDKDLKVKWATSGLSPTLEFRLIKHLTDK